MSDQRRVRFASIEGLTREDLPLAGEIWLDDVFHAPWVSRDVMKLATHFVRHMAYPDTSLLFMCEMEREFQLLRDDIHRALVLMRTFAAIDAFTLEKDSLNVALNLSLLQRLRVLEARLRLTELMQAASVVGKRDPLPVKEPRWVPAQRPAVAGASDAAMAPLQALISEHIRKAGQKLDGADFAA